MNPFETYSPGAIYHPKQEYENVGFSSMNPDSGKELTDKIQERTLQKHFLRMSCERKMDLITKLFYKTRSLHSLSCILNIFFSVNTKLIFYAKITDESNSLYEQFVHDNDRMLDADALNESILQDIKWFATLNNADQINVISSMLRLSGGNVIKKMYWRLIKIFNERKLNMCPRLERFSSRTSMNFPENAGRRTITIEEYLPQYPGEKESDYNQDCPSHKKVVEGRKQWQVMMGKIKKDIEAEIQKLNEPILQKMTTKKPDSPKKKSAKSSKNKSSQKSTSPRPQHVQIDWIQLLPVWTVKKIFSYLDKKVLESLKNVNNYWSIISKEVIAERKMRGHLDWTIKKSEEFLSNLLGTSIPETEATIEKSAVILENTSFKKRMDRQWKTGAAIKVFEQDPNTLHSRALLTECFNLLDSEFKPILTQLKTFPVGVPIAPEADVEKLEEDSIESIHSVIAKVDTASDAASSKHSKSLTVEQEQQIVDELDTITVESFMPSIVVTEENLDTW